MNQVQISNTKILHIHTKRKQLNILEAIEVHKDNNNAINVPTKSTYGILLFLTFYDIILMMLLGETSCN